MGKINWHGSVYNRIAENMKMPAPQIGMGVTQLLYTDRHPFEVIEILSEKKIKIREMKAQRIDHNGISDCQEYSYHHKPDGEVKTLVFINGKWRDLVKELQNDENQKFVEVETRRLGSSGWLLGKSEYYYDFTM